MPLNALALLFLLLAPLTSGAAEVEVHISGIKFAPALVNARVGDTIRWTNDDVVPHTVTRQGKNPFDSGLIMPGKTWTLRASHSGAFGYACIVHPGMKAKLKVRP